jgi:hypothetical protein
MEDNVNRRDGAFGALGPAPAGELTRSLPMRQLAMHQPAEATVPPRKRRSVVRIAAAALFSIALGASPAFAFSHGGGHGGGFHGGGFHGGGFHGGAVHAGGFHGGFHGGYFHHGYGYGVYPGLGLGLALGAAYPWDWGYYGPDYGYYSYSEPYAAGQSWYYCSNPPGYYPYVTQCYAPWQVVPAS